MFSRFPKGLSSTTKRSKLRWKCPTQKVKRASARLRSRLEFRTAPRLSSSTTRSKKTTRSYCNNSLSGTPYRGSSRGNHNDTARMEQVCVLCQAANFWGSVFGRPAKHPRGDGCTVRKLSRVPREEESRDSSLRSPPNEKR